MSTTVRKSEHENLQRRFGDPLQVRKRQRIPLPQGTHEEPFDARLWWLAVLGSWAVTGLIVFGIYLLCMNSADACGDAYQPPQPVKITAGPAL